MLQSLYAAIFILSITKSSTGNAEILCDPDHITMQEAMKQTEFYPSCENCETLLPTLACGWIWMKVYVIDPNDPYEWKWQSWPDAVNLTIRKVEP